MLKKYNDQNNTDVKVLADLVNKKGFNRIMDDALEAFLKLVEVRERFFKSQNEEIEDIVIGQRLGKFLMILVKIFRKVSKRYKNPNKNFK
ncbi:MAG: hypothetical protein CM15mP52_0260 [Candidatus Neomarinimicrobiota bacterium]|nr:MAG: hypothetical protein CM15mP52_0260 [Candidatus Neomarinimicrobiota bacterium]